MNEASFNNEFIKNDIENNKRDSCQIMFFVMKENYIEVRDLDHSFDDYYIAYYKHLGSLLSDYKMGLDHQYWVTFFRETGNSFDGHMN